MVKVAVLYFLFDLRIGGSVVFVVVLIVIISASVLT